MHTSLSSGLRMAGTVAAALLAGPAAAVTPPTYDGFKVLWADDFAGALGSAPNAGRWNVINGNMHVNNELESYSSSARNVALSGNGTLQLVPWRDEQAASDGSTWTSGRVESVQTFKPWPGHRTRIEGAIRMGPGTTNPANAQGLWPAFWLLGDSIRHGATWPSCGEIDILEQRNGQPTGYGTVHCGPACDETRGRGGTVAIPTPGAAHVWSITWDLASPDWRRQAIVWALDGHPYATVPGADIADEAVWAALTQSPFYVILNVAIGGAFPMLEAQYVAVYEN